MASSTYTSVEERDFSRGIDARSSEDNIQPGYAEDILNAEVVEKHLRKRVGHQGRAGNLPVRVTRIQYIPGATDNIILGLDGSVDLGSTATTPLVVYGHTSAQNSGNVGRFKNDADSVGYYPGFTTLLRRILEAPSGTLSLEAADTQLETADVLVGITEATASNSLSNSHIIPDSVSITYADLQVDVGYSVSVDTEVYPYFLPSALDVGTTYVSGNTAVASGATTTVSIPLGTHNLSNLNILTRTYIDAGTTAQLVIPDSVVILPTGEVRITVTNSSGSSADFYHILRACELQQRTTGSAPSAATTSILIPGVTRPFVFVAVYLEMTPGGNLEEVIPESVSWDSTTEELTVEIVNSGATPANFFLYYEFGEARANQLVVTDSTVIVSGYTDTSPQLTVWGLDHSEIYAADAGPRDGWVNHLDSYRKVGENRLVSGLGGNLFSEQTYDEVAEQYMLPRLYPNLTARTDADQVVGPLLWDTGEEPGRTRGYITADGSGLHTAVVTAVEYQDPYTVYTLSLPGKLILDAAGSPTTLASVISVVENNSDYLEISGMSLAAHSGIFRVVAVQDGTDEIFLTVENPSITSSDTDDSGTSGVGSISTDQISFSADSPFLSGDILASAAFSPETDAPACVESGDEICVVVGLTHVTEIPAGLVFVASRTSSVVPTKNAAIPPVADTDGVVRGDMVSYANLGRLLRVVSVNPSSDMDVEIAAGDGETAVVTLTSGSTEYLHQGGSILVRQAGAYSGVWVISDILSDTEFEIESTLEEASSGVLVGNTVELDEQLEWADSVNFSNPLTTESRWIPVEAPTSEGDLLPTTNPRYFSSSDYDDQATARSTMVSDTLFLVDGVDSPVKFDGVNNYRAGIFSWQPGLFLVQDTAATAKIVVNQITGSITGWAGNIFQMAAGNSDRFAVGDRVANSVDDAIYTVVRLSSSTDEVIVDRQISGATGAETLSQVTTYRYYFRLQAVDANLNVVASAVTQSSDYVVELPADSQVMLRLVGLPVWDVLDYDRLELQIYRTKGDQLAPFYLLTTKKMEFDAGTGYLDFYDSFSDETLRDLDAVNTALLGVELGTTWSEPLRSKYVTSLGNSLILANFQDYPQLDIQVVGDSTLADTDFAGETLTFRRSNLDDGTSTDMVDTVVLEWVEDTAAVTPSSITNNAGASFTITTGSDHNLAPLDWVYLYHAAVATSGRSLVYAGWWQVATTPTATTYTVNYIHDSGYSPGVDDVDTYITATAPEDVPVLLGTDGNFGTTGGNYSSPGGLVSFAAMRRASLALNSVMRMTDTTLAGQEDFQPWLVARAGNDFRAGQMVVRQPRVEEETPAVLLSDFDDSFQLFVNSLRRAGEDVVSATTRIFSSRILISYENYPEIFDNPISVLDSESASAVDVNSADGQVITAVIPFYGEAAFGASRQSEVLVVFKTNSIYLVDLAEKRAGRNPVKKIESEGLGCTAPYSVAATKYGIVFANESGIYTLERDNSVTYSGKYLERTWLEDTSRDYLSIMQGTHYGLGRQYKLSIPVAGDTENSEVLVYDHTAEGAWTRFDNHPATGWCNLQQDAFFSSSTGRVFSLRRQGDTSDFRDDSSPIQFSLTSRALDFGNSGVRKVVDSLVVSYKTASEDLTDISLSTSQNLQEDFQATTPFQIIPGPQTTGMGDSSRRKVVSIHHSVGDRKGIRFQFRVEDETPDGDLELTGSSISVALLTSGGIKQAAET